MALAERDRRALEQDVRRLEKKIKDAEAILAYYRREPSMKSHISGQEHEITGLKRELQACKAALQKG